MPPETLPSSSTAERHQAMWPWLLLPLVALALFFALRALKQAPLGDTVEAGAAVDTVPAEVSGSR